MPVLLLVIPLITRHLKPTVANIPLSPGTQIPPNVTIDVGQDAIVANGTTVLIRCNITQVSDYFVFYKVFSDIVILPGQSSSIFEMVQRWLTILKW